MTASMDSKSSRTVLVVGGAGYIGSHVVRLLSDRGDDVIVLDNLSTGHRDAVTTGTFIEGDLGDRALLDRVFRAHRIDAVMHFAAFAQVGESVIDPAKYYDNNVAATLTLLQAMRDAGCRRFVFSSTCATYGEAVSIPIRETNPQNPINPYGRTKLMVEQILADYERAYGLQSVIFRYFNAAGAHPDGTLGERHDPETHLIPRVIDVALRGGAVQVFGNDYPTPDGTCIRDYIHVLDLADAHLRGWDRLRAGLPGGAYNLGNGLGSSVREVISAVEKASGRTLDTVVTPRRPGDPPALVGSADKARTELGWNPQWTSIDAIVESAWNFHSRRAAGAASGERRSG